ncbi:MAG: flavodoxin family protein [Clostridiales bacterium]|nr:flavodoxin family protein [Clostridiales bacterium]
MRVYAINASPRKKFNSGTMLDHFVQGVAAAQADIEVVRKNLYELEYRGCCECYRCRTKGGADYGRCGYPDAIRDLLDDMAHADGIVFSTPIYFHNIPGELRSFMERLLYPFISYGEGGRSCIAPRKIRTAFIYTMNVKAQEMQDRGYEHYLASMENWTQYVFGHPPEKVYAFNTYQYADYSKYEAGAWSLEDKTLWRDTQFPVDCKHAFVAGRRMAMRILQDKVQS